MLTKSVKMKMGRPKLPKGTAKGVLFAVRVAANEAEKIQTAIRKSGLSKPDWARNALINAAAG
ncbi:MAG: hypothetical protein ABSC24_01600 [Verrucomicrobiota bacterium]|jgi:hypothetical protein